MMPCILTGFCRSFKMKKGSRTAHIRFSTIVNTDNQILLYISNPPWVFDATEISSCLRASRTRVSEGFQSMFQYCFLWLDKRKGTTSIQFVGMEVYNCRFWRLWWPQNATVISPAVILGGIVGSSHAPRCVCPLLGRFITTLVILNFLIITLTLDSRL